MKKFFVTMVLSISVLLSSSVVMAQVETKMEGKGNTADAVKNFNKAVAFSGGTVDGNSITEFSSSGNFDDYQARMTVEGDKGKVFLNITVVKKVPDIFTMLIGMETSEQMKIATKIEDRMIKMGYVVDPRYK